MDLLHFKCKKCGTKINKLQNILNIVTLKLGKEVNCSNCHSQYKTKKIIYFISIFYNWILLLFIINYSYLIKLNSSTLLFIIIFIVIEFMIMIFLPFYSIEQKKKKSDYVHYLLISFLTIVLMIISLYLLMYIFGIYDEYNLPINNNEDDLGKAIYIVSYAIIVGIIILPIIVFISSELIKKLKN